MALADRLAPLHTSKAFDLGLAEAIRSAVRKKPKRLTQAQLQFPYLVQAMSLLLANGLPISVAIAWLAPRLSGYWGEQFRILAAKLELGADLEKELWDMAERTKFAAAQEFAQKLSLAITRGVPVATQLDQLAQSLQLELIRNLTKKAGSNETKMLIPTVFLILPVTVVFAIFPSLLVLQANY